MRLIKDDQIVVLLGKRNTGKSFLTRDLLYYHQDIPVGCVISPTEIANRFYSEIMPPAFIFYEYDESITKNIMKRQIKFKKDMVKNPNAKIDPRFFFIMDDCLYDNSWIKDKSIKNIFMNGRHYNILYILLMQAPLGIPPNLRGNIDWVFILRNNIMNDRKRIYENYAGMFPTFESFC